MTECNVCGRVYTLRYRTKREAKAALRALRAFQLYPFKPEFPYIWGTTSGHLNAVSQCVGCRCWLLDRERDVVSFEHWMSNGHSQFMKAGKHSTWR